MIRVNVSFKTPQSIRQREDGSYYWTIEPENLKLSYSFKCAKFEMYRDGSIRLKDENDGGLYSLNPENIDHMTIWSDDD